MSNNFFDYLYGINAKDAPKQELTKRTNPMMDDVIVQDEAIGTPWTHKFTVYCSNPNENFLEELKAKNGVVAVYVKEKEDKQEISNSAPPDAK